MCAQIAHLAVIARSDVGNAGALLSSVAGSILMLLEDPARAAADVTLRRTAWLLGMCAEMLAARARAPGAWGRGRGGDVVVENALARVRHGAAAAAGRRL